MSASENRLTPVELASGKNDELIVGEISFEDASTYKGTLRNGVPCGVGSCTWLDGSQYDGEWRHGAMHGFGTYIWNSGQRYDGQWREGKRHGVGVKLYVDGSVFDGFWHEGLKNGVGVFHPPPKEERNLLKLAPSVKTKTGHEAVLGAVQSAWGSGYDPDLPRSPKAGPVKGPLSPEDTPNQTPGPTKTIEHKSTASTQNGAAEEESATDQSAPPPLFPPMYPATAIGTMLRLAADEAEADPCRDTHLTRESHAHISESITEGPSVKQVENILYIRKFEDGNLVREDKLTENEIKAIFGRTGKREKIKRRVRKALRIEPKLQQKKGQLVFKGMAGYDLMVRLQLGIRISIGRANQAKTLSERDGLSESYKLGPKDFSGKSKIFFPASGSKTTPAHPSTDFKWKDYTPKVFHNLRCMWGCPDAEYMLSLGGSSALWQLNSPGKSGCLFFLSNDEKFLIKTMRKTEIKVLLGMMPEYYKHMSAHSESLVPRYFGVHGVKQLHGRTVRFVVMSNIFCTDLQIHRKFDLKGSTHNRTSGEADPSDLKTVFKDLDLDVSIKLATPLHQRLMLQLAADAKFLREIEVMDYSLLLGVHFCNRRRLEEAAAAAGALADGNSFLIIASSGAAAERTGSAHSHAPLPYPTFPRPLAAAGLELERVASYHEQVPLPHPTFIRDSSGPPGAPDMSLPPTPTPAISASLPSPSARHPDFAITTLLPPPASIASTTMGSRGSTASGANYDAVQFSTVQHSGSRGGSSGGAAPTASGTATTQPQHTVSRNNSDAAQSSTAQISATQYSTVQYRSASSAATAQPQHSASRNNSDAVQYSPAQHSTAQNSLSTTALLQQFSSRNNFDVFSNKEEVSQMLVVADERMRKMGYEEQRINDILGLAKLKILGDKMSASASKSSKSSTVLKAVQQFRKDLQVIGADLADDLSDDGIGGGSNHEHEMTPVMEEGGRVTLGFNMPALAVPSKGCEGAEEEVVLCLGIIDILQDYNVRKVFERSFKSIMNDSQAISVAPPKLYAKRFSTFMHSVFAEDESGRARMAAHGLSCAQASMQHQKVIPEEEDEEA